MYIQVNTVKNNVTRTIPPRACKATLERLYTLAFVQEKPSLHFISPKGICPTNKN